MKQRTALIDMFQQAWLAGFWDRLNKPAFLSVGRPIGINNLVYSLILQAGINRIELGIPLKYDLELPSAVSRRLYVGKSAKTWGAASSAAGPILEPYRPPWPPDSLNFFYLNMFLISLLVAAKRRQNMICVMDYPDPARLRTIIPEDVLLPIEALLAKITTVDLTVPVPIQSVEAQDVTRYEEIIASRDFKNYGVEHGCLEASAVSTGLATARIRRAANALQARFSDVLGIRKLTIGALKVSAQLVDKVCGRFPGKLAEYASDALIGCLRAERQIIIYRADALANRLLDERRRAAAKAARPHRPKQRSRLRSDA